VILQKIGPQLDGLLRALAAVSRPTLEVKLPTPEATVNAVALRLQTMGAELAPLARATQHGLGTLPGLMDSLVQVLTRMEQKLSSGTLAVSAGTPAMGGASVVQQSVPSPLQPPAPSPLPSPSQRPPARKTPAVPVPAAVGLATLPEMVPGENGDVLRFEVDLTPQGTSYLFVPKGTDVDPLRDGGIFVQTHRQLPTMDATISLIVNVVGVHRSEVPAVVTFVREASLDEPNPGFGVRIVRLADIQEKALRRFLLDRDAIVLKIKS
jgi:hypothetical protein